MISFKQLHYALAVEKTLHFKKAAELCHISQSALSTALSELEKQLKLQLFERDNKKVLLTPIGKEVLQRAKQIMLQVDDLEHLADSQQAPLSFPISIGMIPSIAPFLLPKILPLINETYPQAKIQVIEEQSHILVERVRRGEIDTAILALPYDCEGLITLEFWQEDFYLIALKNDDYAQRTEITSRDIPDGELMLLSEGHCLKDHVLDVCKLSDKKHSGNHGFGAASLNTLIQMVLGNLGTTFIPAMAIEQLVKGNDKLTAIHLNEPGPHRRIAFIIRPNYTRMSSIEALISVCKASLVSGDKL